MLYRGLVVEKQIKSRRGKTIHSPGPDDPIHIDTLNVVTTISSYLLGLPVFISGDGFLRDASQKRGKLEKNAKISEAVHLLIKYLEQFHDHAIYFWLDDTGAATELILNELHLSTSDWKSKPITEISQQVDKMLISTPGGVICSSDSGIIDKANSQLFDLAKHTLISAFDPEFIAIQKTYKSWYILCD